MPSFELRRAAAWVALTVLLAAAALACRGNSDKPFRDRLSQIEDRVVAMRGIEPGEKVNYRFVSQQELSDYLAESLHDDETLLEIAHAEDVYRLLDLIPQDASLLDLYGDLLDQQVLGAYDSDTKEFVVLKTKGDIGPLEETTYAHEYTHYLQDTKFGLTKLRDDAGADDDRSMALTALIEGDATATQTQYMFKYISAAGLGEMLQGAGPSLGAAQQAPYVLQRGLEFPYVEGNAFVNQLISRNGEAGVDDAFMNPPQSTEQIIRPSKYFEGEAPIDVTLPEAVFGDGWTETESNVLGQFFLQTWLEAVGAVGQNALAASWGWGGDRYAVYGDGGDRRAFVAVIAWDNPGQDSSEFAQVLGYSLDQQKDFERLGGGIPGALELWSGPGGIVGMVRMADPDLGAEIGIVVAPEREQVVPALARLAGF